eukprot:c5204_g1_i1 orf=3-179(-)
MHTLGTKQPKGAKTPTDEVKKEGTRKLVAPPQALCAIQGDEPESLKERAYTCPPPFFSV